VEEDEIGEPDEVHQRTTGGFARPNIDKEGEDPFLEGTGTRTREETETGEPVPWDCEEGDPDADSISCEGVTLVLDGSSEIFWVGSGEVGMTIDNGIVLGGKGCR